MKSRSIIRTVKNSSLIKSRRQPVILHCKRLFHDVEDSDLEDTRTVKRKHRKRLFGQVFKGVGMVVGAGIGCLCIGLGDLLDERYYENEVSDDSVFLEGTADDMMKKQLRCGDVIMFHRTFFSYNPLHMMKIGLHKLGIRESPWTQLGVIVQNLEEEYEPYVVECNWDGIKVTPYDMRIVTSQCDAISFRHLRTEFTWDQVHALTEWLKEMQEKADNNEGERTSWVRILRHICFPPKSTVALHGEMQYLLWNIRQYEKKLDESNEFEKQKIMKTQKMLQTKVTWLRKEIEDRSPEVEKRAKSFYPDCAVIGEAWKALGILPEDGPDPKEYLPRHFTADIYLPFSQTAYLDEATLVRGLGQSMAAESGAIYDRAKEAGMSVEEYKRSQKNNPMYNF